MILKKIFRSEKKIFIIKKNIKNGGLFNESDPSQFYIGNDTFINTFNNYNYKFFKKEKYIDIENKDKFTFLICNNENGLCTIPNDKINLNDNKLIHICRKMSNIKICNLNDKILSVNQFESLDEIKKNLYFIDLENLLTKHDFLIKDITNDILKIHVLEYNNDIIGAIISVNDKLIINDYAGFNNENKKEDDIINNYFTNIICLEKQFMNSEEINENMCSAFDILFYSYLNTVNSTYLLELNNKYSNFDFEYLYNTESDNNPNKKIKQISDQNFQYYLHYTKNKKIEGIDSEFDINDPNMSFGNIPVVSQNSIYLYNFCGGFVIMYSIFIVNISKYGGDINKLSNEEFIKKLINEIRKLLFYYMKKIHSINPSDNKLLFFQQNEILFEPRGIYNNNNLHTQLSEVNQIPQLLYKEDGKDKLFHYNINVDGIYYNSDFLDKHTIHLSLHGNTNYNYCNTGIFLYEHNWKIIRNFFNLDNFILNFTVGKKCKTLGFLFN